MAQIINRKTPEIVKNGRGIGGDYVTVMRRGFFFSKGVSARIGISRNKFVHFINDESFWSFYINNDPDGFPVMSGGRSGDFVINSEPLTKMFLKSTGGQVNEKFIITPTPARNNSSIVYQINLK